MTKIRKKIGTIPINDIEQQVQQSTQAAVTQMQQDVSDFIDEETAQYPEIGAAFKFQEDPEGRSEITTDSDGKTISYRDSDGVKHEKVGIETKKITLEKEGLDDLGKALKNGGYANLMDWSDAKFVEIPIPTVCAVLNIERNSQAEAKGADIPTYIQFWDKNGNYFRKPVLLNAQGNSSMAYHIKNQAIDLEDGSEIKFGNWPAFDSFHLKKYFIDVFRGQCIVAYWLTEQMYQTREFSEKRPWDYLNRFNDIDNANGSFGKDFDSGALAHPDGFPVHIFFNGVDAGIYAFNIKKARGNYNMKKDKQKQIILDGILGSTFWTANGDMTIAGVEDPNQNLWHDFEIRNPKISKDINGNKYDGDNPKEPSDDYATTKAAIARLTTAISSVAAESSTADKKAKFAEFFNIPFFIDYELISQVIYNSDGYRKNWIWCSWDGNLWCPTSYDMDSIFGQHWGGTQYVSGSDTEILGTSNNIPTGTNLLKGLYATELRSRYKELRDKGIFSVENIVGLLDKWIKACGYQNLKSDIEDICVSPYLENGERVIDSDGKIVLIPNTPSYRDNTKTYVYPPSTGGWYNSVQRVQNWLEVRLSTLDTYYNYSQN